MAKPSQVAHQHVSLQDVRHVQPFHKQTLTGVGEKTAGSVGKRQRSLHRRIRDAVLVRHNLW